MESYSFIFNCLLGLFFFPISLGHLTDHASERRSRRIAAQIKEDIQQTPLFHTNKEDIERKKGARVDTADPFEFI